MEREMSTRHELTRRRIDVSSALLLALGIVFAIMAVIKIETADASAWILIPSVVVATLGASNLVKVETI